MLKLPIVPSIKQILLGELTNLLNIYGRSSMGNIPVDFNLSRLIRSWQSSIYLYHSPIIYKLALVLNRPKPAIIADYQNIINDHFLDITTGDINIQFNYWITEKGDIFYQLLPDSIAPWLQSILNIQVNNSLVIPTIQIEDKTWLKYTYNRCSSWLNQAILAGIININDLATPQKIFYLDSNQPFIFSKSADQDFIWFLIRFVDAIEENNNCEKLFVSLASNIITWQQHCRIFGKVSQHNLPLAQARCGLIAIVRNYLQFF